jgi:hypothetical protein
MVSITVTVGGEQYRIRRNYMPVGGDFSISVDAQSWQFDILYGYHSSNKPRSANG